MISRGSSRRGADGYGVLMSVSGVGALAGALTAAEQQVYGFLTEVAIIGGMGLGHVHSPF
jgi:hypothetical protein